jgi:hypothetical protein
VSGRKQHYIPQCLLKVFAIPGKGKTKKVWVFKKSQPAYVSSVKDVATKRHFYSELSENGCPTLDDRITDYENELNRRLTLIRKWPIHGAVDVTIAAELITHLTIRAAHLRDVFALGAKEMITGVTMIFADKRNMRAFLGIDADAPTPFLQEEIKKVLSTQVDLLARSGLPEPVLGQIAFTLMKEQFDHFYANQSPELMAAFDYMARRVDSIAREAHAKAMTRSLKPEARVQALSQFSWTIHLIREGNLILPDCIAVAIQSNGNGPQPYIVTGVDEINAVLCPISSDRLLVGRKGDMVPPAVEGFNEAAAACSHTFFVSGTQTPELEELSERIGERSRATIQDAVASTVNEFTPKSTTDKDTSQSMLSSTEGPALSETMVAAQHRGKSEVNDAQSSGYLVICVDCADEETAGRIAGAVDTVMSEMSPSIPRERLDRITFAGDYAATLRNMERGFPTSRPLVPTEEDWGIGVAMAPLVIRDGAVKVSIVMQGWLGHALIGEDRRARKTAIHILAGQLARVACVEHMCQTVPEILLGPIENEWEAWLYGHMHAAWTAYFASRISAYLDPEVAEGNRDIMLAVLEKARETILRERLAYRRHGNLDQFLELAVSSIGTVMTYAGTLLGHCDGLCQAEYDDDGCLTQILETMGLRLWIDALRRDLARLFERRGGWESVQEFLALNRHIERVLWQFGVFPWRTEEGQIRVEIPLGTDIAQLSEGENDESTSTAIDEKPPTE